MAREKECTVHLMQHLATDDKVRARMRAQPLEVFQEYRIEVDAQNVPEMVNLPTKQAVSAHLDRHIEHYVGMNQRPAIFLFN